MKKFSAIFMIFLIISVPAYISPAYAAITSISVTGKNNISGILDTTDSMEISVMTDHDINSSDLVTDFPTYHVFDSCNSGRCTYKTDTMSFTPGSYDIKVSLLDHDTRAESIDYNVIVDGNSPSISAEFSEGRNILIDVAAVDTACSVCKNICAGIKEFRVDTDFSSKTFQIDSGSCRIEKTFDIPASELAGSDGKHRICISAVDRTGKASQEICDDLEFDVTPPSVSSVWLEHDGNEVEYIPKNGVKLDIVANVTEKDIRTAYGNFSGLGGSENAIAECIDTGPLCRWKDQLILNSGPYSIFITDHAGNTANVSGSLTIQVDDVMPVADRLYTNQESNVLGVKTGTNRIYAEITEKGSGFNRKNVFLNIQSDTFSEVQAKECTKKEDIWLCSFDAVVTGAKARIGFSSRSMDDAGNFLSHGQEETIIVDDDEPEIEKIGLLTACVTPGEVQEIQMSVKDKSTIYASTTLKILNNKTYNARCTQEQDLHECSIMIDDFPDHYSSEEITIKISDAAGNLIKKRLLLEVCEGITDQIPNFVTLNAYPKTEIDEHIASFIDFPVIIDTELSVKAGAQIIEKNIDCTGDASLIGDGLSPAILLRMKKGSMTNGSMEVSCNMNLKIRAGEKVYERPETENFTVTIPVSSKAKRLGEAIDEKLEQIEDDIKETEDDIESLEKWNDWFKILCSIAETMAIMDATMGLLKSVVFAVASGLTSFCPCKVGYDCAPCEAGWTLWRFTCSLTKTYHDFVQKFIWPVGWTTGMYTNIGAYVKIFCMLYSCKICTLDYADVYADMTGTNPKIVKIVAGATVGYVGGVSVLGKEIISDGLKGAAAGAGTGALSAWGPSGGKPTKLEYYLDGVNMDPYKSIHAARSCLCLPGMIYNYKKKKQILCMYRSCIERNAEAGLPIDVCDSAFKERECLYVEGAQWKLIGSDEFFGFFENLVSTIIKNLPILQAGILWQESHCTIPSLNCKIPGETAPVYAWESNINDVLCHVTGAAITIAEVGDFSVNIDGDKYSGDLEGDTIC